MSDAWQVEVWQGRRKTSRRGAVLLTTVPLQCSAGCTSLAFHPTQEGTFLVGTAEGPISKCSAERKSGPTQVCQQRGGREKGGLRDVRGGSPGSPSSPPQQCCRVQACHGRQRDVRACLSPVPLQVFQAHSMPVQAVVWNPCHQHAFLSASSDWSVRLWDSQDEAVRWGRVFVKRGLELGLLQGPPRASKARCLGGSACALCVPCLHLDRGNPFYQPPSA